MQGYIYKFTNKINGKVYIGQTIELEKRIKTHYKRAFEKTTNEHFYNALRKYGKESFIFEVLEVINTDTKQSLKKELDRLEIEKIKEYDSYNFGYNCSLGGNSSLGRKLSEETKRKIAQSHLGKKASVGARLNMSKAQSGKILSEEHKQKISKAHQGMKGTPHTEEHKKKLSITMCGVNNPFYGKHHTKATKQKLKDNWAKRKLNLCAQ